jgi:PPP family 3-phenylpropionic acid transporter
MTSPASDPDHIAADRRGLAARLSLFYGTAFLTVGLMMPFWPIWLQSRGLSAEEIGLVLAAGMWAKVAANPVAGWLADRLGQRKRIIVVLALAAAGLYACFLLADGFWVILAIAGLYGLAMSPVMPLGDNLTLLTAARYHLDYGRIRLWGSITFIAATYFGGTLLLGTDPDWILWSILAALAAAVTSTLLLPDMRPEDKAAPGHGTRLAALFRGRTFPLFLVCVGCLQVSHAVLYGFGTLHWRQAGLGGSVIGTLWAIGVVAEICVFAVSGRIVAWLGPVRLLLLAGLAGSVRWVVTAETTDVWVLLASQALHGLTFGAAHLGAMHFMTRTVPLSISATAQVLYAALPLGVGMGLVMPLAGLAYQRLGGDAFYLMAALSAGGALLAVGLGRLQAGGAAPDAVV